MSIPTTPDGISPRTPAEGNPWRRMGWRWDCVFALVLLVIAGLVFYPAIQNAREAARKSQCKGGLFSLQFALQIYHETYGCFPPPYIADANGRPMHSWRVLILPFIDKVAIYNEYRFDEPWDGPNNRKLADRIVYWEYYSLFHCPSDEPASGKPDPLMTSYLAVVGPGMAWQDGKCMKLSDMTDGPETTLLLVEVANSGVHWMEPRDLHVLQMAPTINAKAGQGISSRHSGGAHAATADGRCRFLSETLPATTLRGLLTIRGGEPISEADF